MSVDLLSLPDKLLPDDENDPRSVKRYRLRVTLVACTTFLLVVFGVLPAMTVGLPRIGSIAWAAEVDDKIAKAIEPVLTEQRAQGEVLKEIRIDQLATKLRELHAVRCAADGTGRARLDWEIEAAQRKYVNLAGYRYPLPACKDL